VQADGSIMKEKPKFELIPFNWWLFCLHEKSKLVFPIIYFTNSWSPVKTALLYFLLSHNWHPLNSLAIRDIWPNEVPFWSVKYILLSIELEIVK
jgi:hypothetical protein